MLVFVMFPMDTIQLATGKANKIIKILTITYVTIDKHELVF